MGTNDQNEFKNAVHDIAMQAHNLQNSFGKLICFPSV